MLLRTGRALLVPLIGLLAAACPGTPEAPRCNTVAGSLSQPVALQLIGVAENGSPIELHDGDALPLLVPPQGGSVLYAGARATNLRICGVTMSAHLVDPNGGGALSNLDARSSDLTEEHGNFHGSPTFHLTSDLPNIPACPDALGKGLDGKDAILEVTVKDYEGHTGKASVHVVPTCPASNKLCTCVCGPNYHGGC